MKKRFALILTLILATANFTACTEENLNNDIKTSVVSTTADVSVSASSSKPESTTEKETTEKATVSEVVEPTEKDSKSKEEPNTGQNLKSESQNTTTQATEKVETTVVPSTAKTKQSTTVKPTEKNTQKPTPKSTEKVTQKPTQKATEKVTKKEVNIQKAISSSISYGTQLGMNYDPSLNTANASWFSPTNSAYYNDTQSLITACYEDINYVAYYYENDGIKPSDMSFNVMELNKKIYVVYC